MYCRAQHTREQSARAEQKQCIPVPIEQAGVERQFRAFQLVQPVNRAIIGESLGGWGSNCRASAKPFRNARLFDKRDR